MGVTTRTYKRDDHYPICSKLHYGCLLTLYGPTSTMHVATLCFLDSFFFCLVSATAACYILTSYKIEKNKGVEIIGALGST